MSTQPEDKKKAVNYYQGITVPGSPIYYGKRFPSWREFIPLFAGINSHNIKEYFPTICETTGTNGYTYPRS